MVQMFAATSYPFGLYDRDEGADSVFTFAVSADKDALVAGVIKHMTEKLGYAEAESEDQEDGSIHILDSDDMEVYYVINPVESF